MDNHHHNYHLSLAAIYLRDYLPPQQQPSGLCFMQLYVLGLSSSSRSFNIFPFNNFTLTSGPLSCAIFFSYAILVLNLLLLHHLQFSLLVPAPPRPAHLYREILGSCFVSLIQTTLHMPFLQHCLPSLFFQQHKMKQHSPRSSCLHIFFHPRVVAISDTT
jgi:hypothetical protein